MAAEIRLAFMVIRSIRTYGFLKNPVPYRIAVSDRESVSVPYPYRINRTLAETSGGVPSASHQLAQRCALRTVRKQHDNWKTI